METSNAKLRLDTHENAIWEHQACSMAANIPQRVQVSGSRVQIHVQAFIAAVLKKITDMQSSQTQERIHRTRRD